MRRLSSRWTYVLGALAVEAALPITVLLWVALRNDDQVARLAATMRATPAQIGLVLAVHAVVLATCAWLLGHRAEGLARAAMTDPMTGLWNRRYFDARMREEMARAGRDNSPLSLLIFDLDHMKELNDGFGHGAGDRALRDVAEALTRTARAGDVVARCGGDELAVLAPRTTARDASALARRLQRVLRTLRTIRHAGPRVTLSVGVADLEDCDATGLPGLWSAADAALVRAKSTGQGRISLVPAAEESARSGARLRSDVEAALSAARPG